MKEHLKMKPSDNIPEGLEYKSEYWDSALNLIKRKEAQLFWFRIIGLAAAVILILGTVYWQVEQKSAVANLFSSTQPEVIASASPLDQLFSNPEEEARTGAQLNQSSVSMEPNDGLKSNGSVAHEIHQATVTGNLPSGNEPSGHISKSFNSSDPSTSTQIGFETKSSNQFAAEDYTAMNYKATTSTEPLDMELTNLNINETVLLQNKASEFGKNEDTHGQEENIAKANLFEGEELTIKENPADANDEEIEQARKEGNSEESTNGDVDQSYELAKSQNDSQAAEPAGSILENQKSAQGNWSLVPSNLLSKTIQSIPQRHADPGSPIILGNLNSLAQSFPIPHYSIQLVLGNGFKTQYGSSLNSVSYQPVAGLAFDYNLNKKWSWNIEANYSQVNNVLRKIERTDRQLDYILRAQTTLLSTTKLHFMNLPVQLARRLGERHQIHAGLGLSYLLTTDNLIQVSSQTSFESEQGEVQETQGYTQGWKTFSTFGSIGYSYYLKPSTSIRVSYQYGLTDMTDNAEFSHSVYDRNSQLNLTLHFNLIER